MSKAADGGDVGDARGGDIEAVAVTLNGQAFSDGATIRASEQTYWAGATDDLGGPYFGEVDLRICAGLDLEASVAPDEARRLAAQLEGAADRAEREAERRNQQHEIVEAGNE